MYCSDCDVNNGADEQPKQKEEEIPELNKRETLQCVKERHEVEKWCILNKDANNKQLQTEKQ